MPTSWHTQKSDFFAKAAVSKRALFCICVMTKDYKKEIEKIFRESNSSNELFDAFHFALSQKFSDVEIYKILLANPALSKDELKLFTEKLCTFLPNHSYELYSWAAGILENKTTDYSFIEDAVSYYIKASQSNPSNYKPYTRLTRLINYDINYPTNTTIINCINDGLGDVEKKSKIFYALAEVYKKQGNHEVMKKYYEMGEKSARNENQ